MRLIKDPAPLSFDYLPPELPHREKEMEALRRLFRTVIEGGAQNVILQGRVGTGKTASARLFAEELRKSMGERRRNLIYVHVNCRARSSSHGVLSQIVRTFDNRFPGRGFSEEEMLNTIDTKLGNSHLLLILDEMDYLLQRSSSELIYKLTRFSEYTGREQNISIIGISQRDVLLLMDEASRSTFKRSNIIKYPPYTAPELEDIIAQRVRLAFYEGVVKEDAISLIARHSAGEGDARQAIELLEKAGLIAESERSEYVGPEHVRMALSEVGEPIDEEVLESLGRHELLTLAAILRLLRDRGECTTGEAEKEYRALCEEFKEKPRAHTQFWKYINELEKEGLIETEVRSEKGRTTMISTELPVSDTLEIIEERMRK